MGPPTRRAIVPLGLALQQLEPQVGGACREHAPHRTGFFASQIAEDRIPEAHVGRVAGFHGCSVALGERAVEPLDQLLVRGRHVALTLPASALMRVLRSGGLGLTGRGGLDFPAVPGAG